MGNWRTVTMLGVIAERECEPLRRYLTVDFGNPAAWHDFGPLSIVESLVGLCDWVRPHVNAHGNLAERDYTPNDVAEHLAVLLTVAPSLIVKVDCGDDWESRECISTVTALNGAVTIGSPETDRVTAVSPAQAQARLARLLGRRG